MIFSCITRFNFIIILLSWHRVNINTKRNYFPHSAIYVARRSAFTARYELSSKTQFCLVSYFWPYRVFRSQSLPPVTAGGLGMILDDSAQDLNWTNWHWDRLVSEFFAFFPVRLIPRIHFSRLRCRLFLPRQTGENWGLQKKK
jgi:hypothetical protein